MSVDVNGSNAEVSAGPIGKPLSRVDGRLKVTGGARYSAEIPADRLAHGVLVQSAIAKGKIVEIDASDAEGMPGVIVVMTPQNAPKVSEEKPTPGDRKLFLLQDDGVRHDRQNIGVVVAETLEQAMDAAGHIRIRYAWEKPEAEMRPGSPQVMLSSGPPGGGNHPQAGGHGGNRPSADRGMPNPQSSHNAAHHAGQSSDSKRGNVEDGLSGAAVRVEGTYSSPVENHNPMEPHATTAVWEGDHLTLYDSTQGIFGARRRVAGAFGIPASNVRVVCHFTGGGFGCKGSTWSHVILTAMAARMAGRPVRLALARQQMCGPVGFRPQTVQHLILGAGQDGKLTAIRHHSVSQNCTFDEFVERTTPFTREIYACPNVETSLRLVRLDAGTPTYMRGPGESTGSFALESALDELSYRLGIDPFELRLRNYSENDPETGRPWSSKSLRECYAQGAEQFGWARRNPKPRSMTEGGRLVGWGMATASYPTHRSEASARARVFADGTALVQSGSQELGTGTYTVMTQVAAEGLGLPVEKVRFELGDTDFPETPNSGGSQTAASVSSAVQMAALEARDKFISLAIGDTASPLYGAAASDIIGSNGGLSSKNDSSRTESYTTILARHGLQMMEAMGDAKPDDNAKKYAMRAFGAQFAEVQVDPDLGQVRVTRWVGCFGAGRILNAKTARSQMIGGIIYGIGMGLMEETLMDGRIGRVMNADLAEYHVPVNADVPPIEVMWIDEHDPYVNPVGVKGIGEIGITGVAAALANAVYHATGKRVRDLPITLDKVMA
ncbi:MAG: xanthine dehydrogenase family protein molybdopterin-binding subunit [Armatimonadota bacterium]|nr:xanthine dehydrogenase family protein molybdopterin-binding subunit [Armatimonadota bacterium]